MWQNLSKQLYFVRVYVKVVRQWLKNLKKFASGYAKNRERGKEYHEHIRVKDYFINDAELIHIQNIFQDVKFIFWGYCVG